MEDNSIKRNSNIIYYFNDNTILKYLRKVLNEINNQHMDSSMKSAFILKRYLEKYKPLDDEDSRKLVLLCLLKDIGVFYMDKTISNNALAAASSYCFLKNCSPFGDFARPILFYKSKYLEGNEDNKYHSAGLLLALVNQIIIYNYQEYTIDEMYDLIKNDQRGIFHPDQIKKMFKLLENDPEILDKLNSSASLYIYETSKYISLANYSIEELLGFVDTTNFSFEFHNHETLAHTVTVAKIAEELAKRSRLTDGQILEIKLAGLVHDIGKIRVPREILTFPGKLEGEMQEEMRKHVVYTREIIEGCFSYKIVDIAANHHEKLDGSGYPKGLTEIDLSVADKIIAVADIASALYCKRSYKKSFDDDLIKKIMKEDAEAGKLDKRIVKHLMDDFDEIMEEAKMIEAEVLDKYQKMQDEYDALSKSEALFQLFDYEDFETDIFND